MKAQFEGHTPGPWVVNGDIRLVGEIGKRNEEYIAGICTQTGAEWRGEVARLQSSNCIRGIDEIETEANAHLIAAAPHLLAENNALRAAFAVLKELQECSSYWSEYYVPIGIHERIAGAVRNVEALDSGGSDESDI